MIRFLIALVLTGLAWSGLALAAPAPQSGDVLVMVRAAPAHYSPDAAYGAGYGGGRSTTRRVAEGIAKTYHLVLEDAWPMPLLGLDCYTLAARDGRSAEAVVAQVSADPRIEWAEVRQLYKGQSGGQGSVTPPPDDPLYPVQPDRQAWHLDALHAVATGKGVRIAIIDSAVETGHPDLAGQFDTKQDFVTGHDAVAEMHGTGVAGIIGAIPGNHQGIVGVAPGARLMALRACWQGQSPSNATLCDSLSLAQALHFAIDHRAQVVNLSLSGPPDRLLARLIDVALARDIAVVGAVDPLQADGGFPASYPGVVAVLSDGQPSPRNSLAKIMVSAPGRDIPTTEPGGHWYVVSGSSYAAAHVTGLLALVRQKRPHAPDALVSAGGTIDACATLARAGGMCDTGAPSVANASP